MSWWSSSRVESEIMRATSSSIPSGEQDLALNLEISDFVRSKQADSKETLRVLRKRLYDRNPNVQILALHLLDLLVKNGGHHFLVELTSKEFIDAYVAELLSLQNQNRSPEVVQLMLEYFQMWALASESKQEAKYLRGKYQELKRRKDIDFPDPGDSASELSSSFLESETAPEWADSDTCMKSGQPFTFYNRKHHCRNCGGVFLQEYCSNFRPLPHFGINIPVRVCTDCDAKLGQKFASVRRNTQRTESTAPKRAISSNNSDIGSKYRDDLAQAINMSLNAGRGAGRSHSLNAMGSSAEDEELDEDTKRAIEASLADLSNSHTEREQPVAWAQQQQISGTHLEPQQDVEQPYVVGPALPPKEKATLDSFISQVHTATPHDAVYNQRLITLNQSAIGLQPKVIAELRASTDKLSILEDLHGKLLAVSSYYDRLLDAELSPELGTVNTQEAEPEISSPHEPKADESASVNADNPSHVAIHAETSTPGTANPKSTPHVSENAYQSKHEANLHATAPAAVSEASVQQQHPESEIEPEKVQELEFEEEEEEEEEPNLIEL